MRWPWRNCDGPRPQRETKFIKTRLQTASSSWSASSSPSSLPSKSIPSLHSIFLVLSLFLRSPRRQCPFLPLSVSAHEIIDSSLSTSGISNTTTTPRLQLWRRQEYPVGDSLSIKSSACLYVFTPFNPQLLLLPSGLSKSFAVGLLRHLFCSVLLYTRDGVATRIFCRTIDAVAPFILYRILSHFSLLLLPSLCLAAFFFHPPARTGIPN